MRRLIYTAIASTVKPLNITLFPNLTSRGGKWRTKTDQVFHVAVLRLATRYCIRRIAHHISDKLFKRKHILLHLAKHISQVSYRHKIIYIQSFNITKSHTNAIHTLTMSYTYIYIQQIDSLSDTLTIGIFSLFSCDTKF